MKRIISTILALSMLTSVAFASPADSDSYSAEETKSIISAENIDSADIDASDFESTENTDIPDTDISASKSEENAIAADSEDEGGYIALPEIPDEEVADGLIGDEASLFDADSAYEPTFNFASLFSSDGKLIKQSAAQLQVMKADIASEEARDITSNYTGTNFKIGIGSTFADKEHFSIVEENGEKFIRMANDEIAYGQGHNPVSNISHTLPSAPKVNLEYKLRFTKLTDDWFAIYAGNVLANTFVSGKRFGINYGGDYANNPRAQAMFGSGNTTPRLHLMKENVWYTIHYVLNYVDNDFDLTISGDNGEYFYRADIPFRKDSTSYSNAFTIVIPHRDGTWVSLPASLDVKDIVSYAEPDGDLYFSAYGPDSLSDGDNTITLSYENYTGADKSLTEYVAVYDNGVLADVQKYDTVASAGSGEAKITYTFDSSKYSENVTYDVFVLDGVTGANLAIAGGTGSAAPSDFVSASMSGGKLAVAVKSNASYKSGFVSIENPSGKIVYMADCVLGASTNIEYALPADFEEGKYTVNVTAANADGNVAKDSDSVYCWKESTSTGTVSDFNNAETADEIAKAFNDRYDVLFGDDISLKAFYAENSELVNNIIISGKPFSDVKEIADAVNSSVTFVKMNSASDENTFASYFESGAMYFGIAVDSVYDNNKAYIISGLFANRDSFALPGDLAAAYKNLYTLCEFNGASKNTIGAVIEKYASVIGLDTTGEYASKSAYINSLLLKAQPFAAIADINTAFDAACAEASKITGDFTQVVLAKSPSSINSMVIDFEDEELVEDAGKVSKTYEDTSYKYTAGGDEDKGFVSVLSENGNKFIRIEGESNGNSNAYFRYDAAPGVRAAFSYKIRFDELSNGWTILNADGDGGIVSSLYVSDGRFGLNFSGNAEAVDKYGANTIFISDKLTANLWYTVSYNIDADSKTYDLKIISEDGATVADRADVPFRNSASNFKSLSASTAQNTSTKSYISFDDISITSYSENTVYFTAEGTADLMPGENPVNIKMNNFIGASARIGIFIPVYKDGKLVEIVSERYDMANGAEIDDDIIVDTMAYYSVGSKIIYNVFVIGDNGANYAVKSQVSASGNDGIKLSASVNYDTKAIVVSGTTEFDNSTLIIAAPNHIFKDAFENPNAYMVYIGSDTDKKPQLSACVDNKFDGGNYTAAVFSVNSNMEVSSAEYPVYYCGNAVADRILPDFNSATADNVSEIMNKYINTYPVLTSLEPKIADFYAENSAALNSAILAGKPYAWVSSFVDMIYSEFVTDELRKSDSVDTFLEVFEKNASIYGIDTEDSAYQKNKDEVAQRLYKDKASLNSANTAEKYSDALMIAEFNSADRMTIESVLKKYEDKTGIYVSSSLYTNNKSAINKALTDSQVEYDKLSDITGKYSEVTSGLTESTSGVTTPSSPSKVSGGSPLGGKVKVDVEPTYVEKDTQLVSSDKQFADLGGVEWARESIERLKKQGIINGVDEEHFNPDSYVTREEFAKMIATAFNVPAGTKSFADVDGSQWYAPYVASLASSGIIMGISDTQFGIGSNLTRQDAAVILDRAADFAKIDYEYDVSALLIFNDPMADYARNSIQKLYQAGVVNGTSATTFSGYDTLTRAQAAKMIDGLLQLK